MINGWSWLTDHIPVGQHDAISAEDLSKTLEMEKRDLRRAVENARRENILICGDQHGYYFAANDAEMGAYVHRVRGRIRTGFICLVPFLRQLKQAEGGGGT